MDNRIISTGNSIIQTVPTYLVYAGCIVLLIDSFLGPTFGLDILRDDKIRIAIALSIIPLFVISINKRLDQINSTMNSAQKNLLGLIEVLHHHERIDFKEILERCKSIKLLTISGTKIATLGDGGVQEGLGTPLPGQKITILLANPFSDAIVTRYARDEPETYEAGIEGITRRLIYLHKLTTEQRERGIDQIDIRVFDNYPTIAVLAADDDIFSTVYGYKLRGGDCPKIHVQSNSDYGSFITKHFDMIYRDAVPLQEWFDEHEERIGETV